MIETMKLISKILPLDNIVLDADSTSGLPVLLRVDSEAGHALASTAEQKRELFTDEMSFLFWQLGVPGFQPPAPRSSQSIASTHK